MTGRDFQIGEVEAREGGARVRARVPLDLAYLEGHFPGNPIVPGIAQLLLVERAVRRAFSDLGPLKGLTRLKFEVRIDPGDEVVVDLARTESGVRFAIVRGETTCSRGTLLF
jgi:3-hydroxymyristoyl/3-hydroxydecanoyl-(acyl carrier protein) dehydratase